MNRRKFLKTTALATGAFAGFSLGAQEDALKINLSIGAAAAEPVPVDYLGFSAYRNGIGFHRCIIL